MTALELALAIREQLNRIEREDSNRDLRDHRLNHLGRILNDLLGKLREAEKHE